MDCPKDGPPDPPIAAIIITTLLSLLDLFQDIFGGSFACPPFAGINCTSCKDWLNLFALKPTLSLGTHSRSFSANFNCWNFQYDC